MSLNRLGCVEKDFSVYCFCVFGLLGHFCPWPPACEILKQVSLPFGCSEYCGGTERCLIEMIMGWKITGFHRPVLIVDWPLSASL